jgi:hypothetical protein
MLWCTAANVCRKADGDDIGGLLFAYPLLQVGIKLMCVLISHPSPLHHKSFSKSHLPNTDYYDYGTNGYRQWIKKKKTETYFLKTYMSMETWTIIVSSFILHYVFKNTLLACLLRKLYNKNAISKVKDTFYHFALLLLRPKLGNF